MMLLAMASFAAHHKLLDWKWDWTAMYLITTAIPTELLLPYYLSIPITILTATWLTYLWDWGESDREYAFITILFVLFGISLSLTYSHKTTTMTVLIFSIGVLFQRIAEHYKSTGRRYEWQYQTLHSIWHLITATGFAIGAIGYYG